MCKFFLAIKIYAGRTEYIYYACSNAFITLPKVRDTVTQQVDYQIESVAHVKGVIQYDHPTVSNALLV